MLECSSAAFSWKTRSGLSADLLVSLFGSSSLVPGWADSAPGVAPAGAGGCTARRRRTDQAYRGDGHESVPMRYEPTWPRLALGNAHTVKGDHSGVHIWVAAACSGDGGTQLQPFVLSTPTTA